MSSTVLERRETQLFVSQDAWVWITRLLSLLATGLILLFGLLLEVTNPEVTDPMWLRLSLATSLLAFVGGTYVSETLRRWCVEISWSFLYLLLAWATALAGLNGLPGEYALGVLLIYAIAGALILLSSRSTKPVWAFLLVGLLTASAPLVPTFSLPVPSAETSPAALALSLFSVAVLEGTAGRWVIRMRNRFLRQDEELKWKNDLLERTQEIANVGAWEYDVASGDAIWTEQAHRITQHPPEADRSPENTFELYHPEDRPRVREALRRALEEGESFDLEARIVSGDEQRWVRARGEPKREAEVQPNESGAQSDGEVRLSKKPRSEEESGGEGVAYVRGTIQDITARKREERRRKQVISRVTDGILKVDSEWQVTLVNEQAEALYGIAEEEMLGRSLWEVFGQLEGSRFEEVYREAMRSREPATIEERYSGMDEWFDVHMYPSESGGLDFYFRIVTDQKEREEALRRAKSRYQTLIENFPGGVFLFDQDLRYTLASGRELRNVGLSSSAVEGSSPRDIFPDELADELEEYFQRALDGEKNAFEQTMDGCRYFNRTLPVRDESGTVIAGMAVSRDITERRRRKRDLERKNDLFRRAQEIASVGAWEFDFGAQKHRLTDQAYRIHGLPPGVEMTPERSHGLYHPDDRPEAKEAFRRAVEEGKSYDIEARLITEGGEEKWIRSRGEPQREDGEVVRIRGVIQDITEQKRREKALHAAKIDADLARQDMEKALEEAKEANRLKSAFLANISHEIRTPLTSIIGFAELIGEEAGELDLPESPLPGYADIIERGGKRLLETLDGVLNLSKLQSGQMELETRPVDLSEQARHAAEELRGRAKEKGLDLNLETSPAVAEADEGGVQILLRNLLSNAIKYTDEGSVTVRTYREGKTAVLEVEDTGIGMDPEAAEGLFEPFRQASEGFSREYEGTGVGLAVTNEAAEQMDGRVEVETQKGKGSRFSAHLPACEDSTEEA